jgi:hypothetical protein
VVDPARFQTECVEEFVASWTARGFSEVTIANDVGVLERMLAALGRPAWEVTAEDVDRVVGSLRVTRSGRVDPAELSAGVQGVSPVLGDPQSG